MPDYLSPGVYIEELPPQLRAIEGVSTSIAGLVGVASRGAVPGFPLPFTPTAGDPQVVTLVPTPTPVLVTSFADFARQFGDPLPLPDPIDTAYLGYAVQGFFSNGGKICYISRVVHFDLADLSGSASYGMFRLDQGVVLRLARDAAATDTKLSVVALRGIAVGGAPDQILHFFHKDGTPVAGPLKAQVAGYNTQNGTVDLTAPIGTDLAASDVYALPGGVLSTAGPAFWARSPGAWSERLSVSVTPSRRRAVPIIAPALAVAQEIRVASTSGFYVGAILEVDNGTSQTYHVVSSLGGGGLLELEAPLGVPVAASTDAAPTGARIVEIDITIVDPTPAVPVTETYKQLTWNPDSNPDVRARHYSTAINAQSQLVYVQPPGVGGLDGTEAAELASQPSTFNGWPTSLGNAVDAIETGSAVLKAAVQTTQALESAVNDMGAAAQAAAPAPLPAADPTVAAVASAATAATTAATNATNAAAAATGASLALAPALAAVATAANTAVTQANSAIAAAEVPDLAALATAVAAVTTSRQQAQAAAVITVPQFGSDGNDASDDDYIGVDNGPNHRSGIQALADAEGISIIAAPGRTGQSVQNELINQCELLKYRFAILDGEQDPPGESVNGILSARDAYDTSYAAYYVPWLQVTLDSQNLFLPPSGHVAGVYAGTDTARGVWKAPANVVVQNITGLKAYLTTGEQDVLNPAGVDVIRRFDTLGIRVWGARTLSSDTDVQYVNVRRTLIYLEASIDRGTQWVVFEPNTPDTWDRVTDSVSAFLTTQWRNGALFGLKPSDAFFVRCDETTMTADDIQNGRLICQIGVAIVRPAEFVIFRIQQITGFANQ